MKRRNEKRETKTDITMSVASEQLLATIEKWVVVEKPANPYKFTLCPH
jgi:hypothetical protein